MKQSRVGSLVEVVLGTAIGFFVALVAQWVIFPLYGIHITHAADMQIVVWFTLISILRAYVVRRLFAGNAWSLLIQWYKLRQFKRLRAREMRSPSLSTESKCGCGCAAPTPEPAGVIHAE